MKYYCTKCNTELEVTIITIKDFAFIAPCVKCSTIIVASKLEGGAPPDPSYFKVEKPDDN